jgi:hypothetical protein
MLHPSEVSSKRKAESDPETYGENDVSFGVFHFRISGCDVETVAFATTLRT